MASLLLSSFEMKSVGFILLLLGFFAPARSQDENENVRRIMKEMEVVPEILDEPPKELLKVSLLLSILPVCILFSEYFYQNTD